MSLPHLATALAAPVLAVTEEETVVSPPNVGVGSVVLTAVVVVFLAWVGWLVLSSRRHRASVEETPSNLQPYLSDDELENKRVTRVLNAAVVVAAVLALSMPIYFINESGRQEAAADKQAGRIFVEEGEHWFTQFSCVNCRTGRHRRRRPVRRTAQRTEHDLGGALSAQRRLLPVPGRARSSR